MYKPVDVSITKVWNGCIPVGWLSLGLVVFYCRCNGPVVKSMLYQTIVGCISSTGRYVIPCTRSA